MRSTSNIRTALVQLAAVALMVLGVALMISIGARAQDAPTMAVAGLAGRWLHDAQGNVIGSVRGPADNGRTARLMIGSYFRPGSHEIRVPAGALSESNGVVTLRSDPSEPEMAANLPPRR